MPASSLNTFQLITHNKPYVTSHEAHRF